MSNMILTYVPESEHLTCDEALALAEERDEQAADEFKLGLNIVSCKVVRGEYGFKLVPEDPEDDWTCSLVPPHNPREVWGKI